MLIEELIGCVLIGCVVDCPPTLSPPTTAGVEHIILVDFNRMHIPFPLVFVVGGLKWMLTVWITGVRGGGGGGR